MSTPDVRSFSFTVNRPSLLARILGGAIFAAFVIVGLLLLIPAVFLAIVVVLAGAIVLALRALLRSWLDRPRGSAWNSPDGRSNVRVVQRGTRSEHPDAQ